MTRQVVLNGSFHILDEGNCHIKAFLSTSSPLPQFRLGDNPDTPLGYRDLPDLDPFLPRLWTPLFFISLSFSGLFAFSLTKNFHRRHMFLETQLSPLLYFLSCFGACPFPVLSSSIHMGSAQ
jgi:hypothetical protein